MRSTHSLESPVAYNGEMIVSQEVLMQHMTVCLVNELSSSNCCCTVCHIIVLWVSPSQYLTHLVKIGNGKMEENLRRVGRLALPLL